MAMAALRSSLPPQPISRSSLPDSPEPRFFLPPRPSFPLRFSPLSSSLKQPPKTSRPAFQCFASDVSVSEVSPDTPAPPSTEDDSWVPVIPVDALPKGERRLVRQSGQDVLLLWYKNELYAIENTSPAEGAYSEGFVNAKLTQDGCIVCGSTESTFDLKTGEIREWYPTNAVLRFLTPPLRNLTTYPVKIDSDYIYINTQASKPEDSAEIVFGGKVEPGKSATNVEVDEVRMFVDEDDVSFGFTPQSELANGRAAMVGFSVLLVFELISGKGFLKGIGFLDFLYRYLPGFPILKY